VMGPDHPLVANQIYNTCEALNALGRYDEARSDCARALRIWEAAGSDSTILTYGRTGLGIALLGLGRGGEATPPLELAVRDRVGGGLAPALIAESRFALARALWTRPAEHARARALARQAREGGAKDAKLVARIDAWTARVGAALPPLARR